MRLFKSVMALVVALLFLAVCSITVFASSPGVSELNINLQINASWGGGDIINLDIIDLDTMERQQVAIRLSDFIHEDENARYILLQAMDLLGERQSGVIQIENPLFDPSRPPASQTGQTVGDSGSSVGVDELPENIQNIVTEANQSTPPPQTLTPDGTGTVVDNIMTVNNIEFFTVTTDNGSDFFLVVDRQRTSNNVYLLNTVTEADLMALAEARGETLSPSSPNAPSTQPSEPAPAPTLDEILQAIQEAAAAEQNQGESDTTPSPPSQQGGSSNSGIIILMVMLLALVVGGIAAWKLLLPKLLNATKSKQGDIEDDEDYDNDFDDGDEDYSSGYESVEVDEDEDDDFGHDHDDSHDTDDSHGSDIENVHGGEDDNEYA